MREICGTNERPGSQRGRFVVQMRDQGLNEGDLWYK